MPLSTWIAAAPPGNSRANSRICEALFRHGIRSCARRSGASPGIGPERMKISGPLPTARRSAAPSSASATKKLRTPAARSAGPTVSAPSP